MPDDQPSKDRRKSTQAGVVGHYSPAACHDGIPVAPHAQIPAAYNPSLDLGPFEAKPTWLAHRSRSPDPRRSPSLTLPSVSASLDHWQ